MESFIIELRKRRVLPAVGVYVAGSWVLIEILDRLTERYLLSPYLTDIVFWGLFSLIPAVMLLAWTHGRPGKDKATRAEKVGIPINLIATLGLLITVFGDKDLDQAGTRLTVSNELGQQETHIVPNESFRHRMAVFFWNNGTGDSELDWLQYGITELLVQDLSQDPFILANSPWNNYGDGFYPRMKQAGFDDGLDVPRSLMRKIAEEANRQYFVEGDFTQEADEFLLSARIWDSQSLQQIEEVSSRDHDMYRAIDRLSVSIRRALDVPESGTAMEDLPLAETYGESEQALKTYIQGLNVRLFDNDYEASIALFEQAVEIDPNFVLAWMVTAVSQIESGNLPAAQAALKKAREMDYRLPARDRAQIKALNYRLAGDHEKLMAFLQLQVRIRDDASSHNTLASMYMVSGELEKAKTEFLEALERDALNVGIFLQMSALERATGNVERAVEYARKYRQQRPEDIEANLLLGDLLRDSGQLEAAEEHYKQAEILQNSPVQPMLKLSLLAARKGDTHAARAYLAEAEASAGTPLQKIQVRQAAANLEARLGRIQEAIRHTRDQEPYLRESQAAFAIALSLYVPQIEYYLAIGDTESARDAFLASLNMVEPPMDQFFAFGEALILARERNFEAARKSLALGKDVIDRFRLNLMAFQVPLAHALISREQGDSAAEATSFLEALDMIENSVLAGDLQVQVPSFYAALVSAQVRSGQLDEAEKSLEKGFRLDPSEPRLWLAKARLHNARNLPRLALASVNYALAIWEDADRDFILSITARELAAALSGQDS